MVRHGGVTNESLIVNLLVDQPDELQLPTSATITSNSTELLLDMVAAEDGVVTGSRTVMVTATAINYGPAQLTLVVTDEMRPDLVASEIDAPTALGSDEPFDVSYLLENRGSGSSSLPFSQRIFLSEDAVPGGDILLTQRTISQTLMAGESLSTYNYYQYSAV